jgi:hypothetical protein
MRGRRETRVFRSVRGCPVELSDFAPATRRETQRPAPFVISMAIAVNRTMSCGIGDLSNVHIMCVARHTLGWSWAL